MLKKYRCPSCDARLPFWKLYAKRKPFNINCPNCGEYLRIKDPTAGLVQILIFPIILSISADIFRTFAFILLLFFPVLAFFALKVEVEEKGVEQG